METTILIMAGGKGERFWPESRKACPKQFLKLLSPDQTMLQMTVSRVLPITSIENIFISTNAQYRDLVQEQLPDLPLENIICEPIARNTSSCIGLAAEHMKKRYQDAVMVVLPADHMIRQEDIFRDTLSKLIHIVNNSDELYTLGISPTEPDTGYGYIRYASGSEIDGAYRVESFVEKPDLQTAKKYLDSGNYLWNSGMFVWKVSTILKAIQKNLPENFGLLEQIGETIGQPSYEKTLETLFAKLKSISIDYGVMEHSDHIRIIPALFGWDDIGSWNAIARFSPTNDHGNAISGDVVTIETNDCIIRGGQRLISTIGLDNLIIVDMKDTLLICCREDAGKIKKVLEVLQATNRDELL